MRDAIVNPEQSFGIRLAPIGDIDGDGFRDVVAHGVDVVTGEVLRFLSGRDGTVLRVRPTSPACARYFNLAGIGDVDGDGCADYATAVSHGCNPLWGAVELRSGRDDLLLRTLTVPGAWYLEYGWRIVGDVDLDGVGGPDLLITTRREPDPSGLGFGGSVHAYAHDGQLLYKRFVSEVGVSIGHGLSKVGDVDGDGRDDYVVGGSGSDPRGVAFLFSGAAGRELLRVHGERSGDDLGGEVAGCDDLDGDGLRDFVVGTQTTFGPGTVQAFSSATGQRLYTWRGGDPAPGGGFNGFGWVLRGDLDLDRDGIDDILVGAQAEVLVRTPRLIAGAVHAYSGRDGSELFVVSEPSGYSDGVSGFGSGIAPLGVQPDSPFPVFAVSSPRGAPYGRVHAFRGAPAGVGAYGSGCAGALAAAPQIGIRSLSANGTRVHLSNTPPGATVALSLGLSRTLLPLDGIGMWGCSLRTSSELLVVRRTGQAGLDAGHAQVDIPLPIAVGPGTFTLHGQWLVLGAGPLLSGGVSGALSWRH